MTSTSDMQGARRGRERLTVLGRAVARNPLALLALAAAATVVVLAETYSRSYFGNVVDDSLTSMHYARNLALGNGVVFNPGERVEGYTNFLWVLVMAPLYLVADLFGTSFVRLAVHVSILFAAADVVLVYLIGRRLWGRNVAAIVAALGLCVVDNSYAVWAAMALEKHFFAFWLLLAVWLSLSELRWRPLWIGLCLAFLQMTRPDGALFSLVFVANEALTTVVESLRKRSAGKRRRLWASLGVLVAAWLGVYGAYFVWRYGYYGFALPNTYYVKLASPDFDGWERGLRYAIEFAEHRAWAPLVALPAVLWLRSPTVRVLWLWTVFHSAYVVYVGGDFYPGHRYFVVAIPAIALLGGQLVFGISEPFRQRRVAGVTSPAAAAAFVSLAIGLVVAGLVRTATLGLELGPVRTEILRFRHKVEANRRYMVWLGERAPPGASLAGGDIGSCGYYTGLRIIDVYGIIDPAVAHRSVPNLGRGKAGHEKHAGTAYVLAKKPTYVKYGYIQGDLYTSGYFLDGSVPLSFDTPGLWTRDTLESRGRWHPGLGLDFAPGRFDGWAATGTAFERWPTLRSDRGQGPIVGRRGAFLSTYHATLGDRATGRLESSPIALVGDAMVLRVGGGFDPLRLTVSLKVDGERVHTATGRNSEALARHVWDISGLRGRAGVLEVVDDSEASWGHIAIDEVRQWSGSRS